MRGVLMVGLALVGCGGDFDPGSLLVEPRVIGAIHTVAGAPDRVVAAPGETQETQVLVGQPTVPAPFTWALAACLARPTTVNLPACEGAPFFTAGSDAPVLAVPPLAFEVPPAVADGLEVLLIGVHCVAGTPDVEGLTMPRQQGALDPCTEPGGLVWTQALAQDPANTRPRFPEDSLRFEGAPWPSACVSLASFEGADPEITFLGLDTVTRDTVTTLSNDQPPALIESRETLFVSHYTSEGELERQFNALGDGLPAPSPVEWQPPEMLGGELRVRFVFTLFDGRGGTDVLERELCVFP